jgi:hypothetical protein
MATLTGFRARVRERADMVGSAFVTDDATSLDAWINSAAKKLHRLLAAQLGSTYQQDTQTAPVVAANPVVSLPAGVYKILAVFVVLADGRQVQLKRHSLGGLGSIKQNAPSLQSMTYRVAGDSIELHPPPPTAGSLKIVFIPQFTPLVAGADATPSVMEPWEEFVVVDAAIQVLAKEESDPSLLMAERDEIRRSIMEEAEQRVLSTPRSAVDMDARDLSATLPEDYWEW